MHVARIKNFQNKRDEADRAFSGQSKEFLVRLKRAIRRLAHIRKYANSQNLDFDAKNFDLAKLTCNRMLKNKEMPKNKKDMVEKLVSYMDFSCFFDEEMMDDVANKLKVHRQTMVQQTYELKQLERLVINTDFSDSLHNSKRLLKI